MKRLSIALGIATAALYLGVWDHAFVEFDDPLYVTANSHVQQGLTIENVYWAFTSDEAFIWHPLTWLSYLVDFELYGASRAGPWLATNVALHVANAVLLFVALGRLAAQSTQTVSPWACAFAAGLFALHPIQVESVAWVSSRKELLAGLFFVLTLLAYARYAHRRDRASYRVVLLLTALGVMAKGSHVGLPFALLLLDYWPLRRIRFDDPGPRWAALWPLVREKLPLLAICVAAVVVNLAMVSSSYNVFVVDPPVSTRLGAAAVNLTAYLGRLLWPAGLAIVYPNPLQSIVAPAPHLHVAAALALLVGVAILAARSGIARGYLVVGWLWFVGMLLPMLGLVPAGMRTPHDRYLYVPIIGLALAAAFGLRDLAGARRARRGLAAAIAVVVLVLCAALTRRQIAVWRDSEALFQHALRVTERNAVVHYSRGTALARQGQLAPALRELEAALALHPDYADANNNLGYLLVGAGQIEPGIAHLKHAVAVRPNWTRALLNLGSAQVQAGLPDEAIETFRRAVASAPDEVDARRALEWLEASAAEAREPAPPRPPR